MTGFIGTVNISATGAPLSGDPVASEAFTAGVLAAQSLMFTNAGSSIVLTVTGSGKTGTSNAFTVKAVPVSISPPVITNTLVSGQTFVGQATSTSGTVIWDFGDGTPQVTTASGAIVTHTYAQPGAYTVTITPAGGASATYTVFDAFPTTANPPNGLRPGATLPPGTTGIIIGSAGLRTKTGSSAKIACDYIHPAKTSISGAVGTLAFPASMQQAQLKSQTGTLMLGSGATKQTFMFTLDKNGKGKSSSLPTFQVNLKKKKSCSG